MRFILPSCVSVAGGTNDSDHSDSASMKKCLRKTRGELLFREYEVLVYYTMCFFMFTVVGSNNIFISYCSVVSIFSSIQKQMLVYDVDV